MLQTFVFPMISTLLYFHFYFHLRLELRAPFITYLYKRFVFDLVGLILLDIGVQVDTKSINYLDYMILIDGYIFAFYAPRKKSM